MAKQPETIARVRTGAQTTAGIVVAAVFAVLNERFGISLEDRLGESTTIAVYAVAVPFITTALMAAADRWPILQALFLVRAKPDYGEVIDVG